MKKKLLVYTIMVALFAGFMWLIFAPSGADREALLKRAGFNADIPLPRGEGIVADKRTAYEQELMRGRQRSLHDYSEILAGESAEERTAREQRELAMIPKPTEDCEVAAEDGFVAGSSAVGAVRETADGTVGGALRSSAAAHAELAGTLDNFFEEPVADTENERTRRSEADHGSAGADELALLERSYQLAAKYTSGGGSEAVSSGVSAERPIVLPVAQACREVVSRLGGKVVRRGLYGLANGVDSAADAAPRNTISAVVHGDQTVTDGQSVRLRTGDAMRVGRLIVPAGTVITGAASVAGERLEVVVTAIEYGGNILPVELSVHDLDGQRGLRIPGSMELDAAKEIIGGMGQSAGTTISLGGRQSAGGQLLAELGRGVIQGTSQYVANKAKVVKVKLRAGYKLFLLPKNN